VLKAIASFDLTKTVDVPVKGQLCKVLLQAITKKQNNYQTKEVEIDYRSCMLYQLYYQTI